MTLGSKSKDELLTLIRTGGTMSRSEQFRLMCLLSLPSIIAQMSAILMQYIDAAMVGSLGATASASIGLVSTTTWLFWGLCTAAGTGFSVQVAHHIGAGQVKEAKRVLQQAFVATLFWGLLLSVIGCIVSRSLPFWLGGTDDIADDSMLYFRIFSLSLPFLQLSFLAGSMLRCSGNMMVPGVVNAVMCLLDVVFNALLIFPTRKVVIADFAMTIPGADLGVMGAAIGTALAEIIAMFVMLWYLYYYSDLKLVHTKVDFTLQSACMRKALHIGLPMGGEHLILCGAQILTTIIVAPLGTAAIAANAFAITAESLCYMPGYGIAEAATTLVGQSLGAARRDLTRCFAHISVFSGMFVMTVMGIVMYLFAPLMMAFFTPDELVRSLGVMALRTEAFAEPMFAASIVAYGVFVGAGDTLIPCSMNLCSIWVVRLTLAAILAPNYGLQGVWIAMCVELCFRGVIFLIRLYRERWMKVL